MGSKTKNSGTKVPIEIKIIRLPAFTIFGVNDRLSFFGMLCKVIYDDGDEELLVDPYVEFPEEEYPGTYKANIYLDRSHSYGLHTTLKYRIFDKVK